MGSAEYAIPDELSQYHDPGMDVEVLPDGNILLVLPRHGVYEINRDGDTVWSHLDPKISHDADRLANGNTLIQAVEMPGDDSAIMEVTPTGEIVWQLKIKDAPATGTLGWFYKAQRVCGG